MSEVQIPIPNFMLLQFNERKSKQYFFGLYSAWIAAKIFNGELSLQM